MIWIDLVVLFFSLFQDSDVDGEEEDEDPTEDPYDAQDEQPSKMPQDEVTQSLHTVESGMELEKALTEESTDLEKAGPPVPVSDIPAEHRDDAEDAEEPEVKKVKVDRCVKTLADVLSMSNLAKFNPSAEDTEHDLFQRMDKMRPYMNAFSTLVRCGEGLLGKAVITGDTSKLNAQQIFEMELSKANLEFHCSGHRQSRFALWADYSQRLFQALQADQPEEQPEDAEEPVREITGLRPCSYLDDNGQRVSQVVLVRTCMAGDEAGPLRLGLVMTVFRGGKGPQNTSKSRPWLQGELPVRAATYVHIKQLVPQNIKDEKGELCVCSSLTPTLTVDAHDGSILLELGPNYFTCKFSKHHVQVWVRKPAIKAMFRIAKANVPFEPVKKAVTDGPKTFYSEDDFGRTLAGGKNIQKFMLQKKRDFEKHCGDLEDKHGNLKLKADVKVTWGEMSARAPSYFRRFTKGHDHWKKLTKEYQQKPFPGSVKHFPCQTLGKIIEEGFTCQTLMSYFFIG